MDDNEPLASHPLNFRQLTRFTCADPLSLLVFEPGIKRFHWHGPTLDMLGSYTLIQKGNVSMIELNYNYAREQTLSVVSVEGLPDQLASFLLKSHRTNKTYFFLLA